MKLLSVSLKNFRQFKEETTIEFSTDSSKNVTLIHGCNGSGKTTFINAFRWLLYGTCDYKLEKIPHKKVLESIKGKKLIEVIGILKFEHDSKEYEAKRILKVQKNGEGKIIISKPPFALNHFNDKNKWVSTPDPETNIRQILPEDLQRHFFLAGEKVLELSRAVSSTDIKEAIKTLFGLKAFERSIRHLKMVLKQIREERKDSAPEDLKETELKLEIENENKNTINDKLLSIENNITSYHNEIDLLSGKLKFFAEANKLQKEREEKQIELDSIKEKKLQELKDKKRHIGKYGFIALSTQMVSSMESFLNDKRTTGELPGDIKEGFLKDLLEIEHECICGRGLKEGSNDEAINNIKKLIGESPSNIIQEECNKLFLSISGMKSTASGFTNTLEGINQRIVSIDEDEEKVNTRLNDISRQLVGSSEVDVSSLEKEIISLETKRDEANKNYGKFESELEGAQKMINELENVIKESNNKTDKFIFVEKKYKFANETLSALDKMYNFMSKSIKDDLSKEVNEIFESIIAMDFWLEIDDSYTLRGKEKVGEKTVGTDLSTGQQKVASISFIGGIVKLCKSYMNKKNQFIRGGIFPLVMDAPFPDLDETHSLKSPRLLPSFANQVVVLISDKQYRGEVEQELKGYVGKEYTFIHHTNKKFKNPPKKISRIYNCEFEETKLKQGFIKETA